MHYSTEIIIDTTPTITFCSADYFFYCVHRHMGEQMSKYPFFNVYPFPKDTGD